MLDGKKRKKDNDKKVIDKWKEAKIIMNYKKERERISNFIRDYCRKSRFENLVIGLSGGVDSALVSALAVQAIGREHLFAFCLPSRESNPESVKDAILVAECLDISIQTINIDEFTESYFKKYAPKGEFTLVLAGADEPKAEMPGTEEIKSELNRLVSAGMMKKEAIKEVAGRFKVPKNEVYKLSLEDNSDI